MAAVSIVSVPHTGTKFTEYVLLAMGCDVRHAHLHSGNSSQDARQWFRTGAKIVVPWREPQKAAESARKRGEEPRPDTEFWELQGWATFPHVHVFRVEPEDRPAELAALAAFVGADAPDIDWSPVNAWEGP